MVIHDNIIFIHYTALLFLTGLSSKGKLFCTSHDLLETFTNPSTYCTLSGKSYRCICLCICMLLVTTWHYRHWIHVWNGTVGTICSISRRWSLLGGCFSIPLSKVQSWRKTQVHSHCYSAHCIVLATSSSSTSPQGRVWSSRYTNGRVPGTKCSYHLLHIYPTHECHPGCGNVRTCRHVLENFQGIATKLL